MGGWIRTPRRATQEVLAEFFGDEADEKVPCDVCLILQKGAHHEACPVRLVN
jgi:hypothetical protein